MVATSHDVMPDIELISLLMKQTPGIVNTLAAWLASRWQPGYLRLAKGPQQGGRRHDH